MALIPPKIPKNLNDLQAGSLFLDTDRNTPLIYSDGMFLSGNTPEGWVNVKDFGAKGDGTTDDTQAFLQAIATGKNLYIPYGEYKINQQLVLQDNTSLIGNNAILHFSPFSTEIPCIVLGKNCVISDITIDVPNSTYLKTFPTNNYVSDFYYSLNHGITANDNCLINNVTIKNTKRGIRTNGNNVVILNSTVYGANWGMNLYNKEQIYIINTKVYGGSEGGLAFPSAKKVMIANCYVVNPDGTGINSGGSQYSNTIDITVTNNIVVARDCYNFENGAENITVSNNIAHIWTSYNYNGVGISVNAHSDTSGINKNIVISNNLITDEYTNKITYATGIRVNNLKNTSTSHDAILINNNIIKNSNNGILAEGHPTYHLKSIQINNNLIISKFKGISLINIEDGNINNNSIIYSGSTTISETYAFVISNLTKTRLHNNYSKGFYTIIRQDGPVTDSKVTNHIHYKGDDNANYLTLINNSATTDINITFI